MRRRVAVAATIALVAASASACSSGRSPTEADSTAIRSPACGNPHPAAGYALADDQYKAVLRPLMLCPLTLGAPVLEPGVEQQRVSWLTAGGGRTVVAASGTGSDTLLLVQSGSLVPIPGLGKTYGHSPALGPDGRLLFTQRDPKTEPPDFVVQHFDPESGTTTTLFRSKEPPSGASWGPNGAFAFLAGTGGADPHLLVFDSPSAAPRRVATVARAAVSVFWAQSGEFVVGEVGKASTPGRAHVLDRQGQPLGDLPFPWQPVGFTPDGVLIVVRHDNGLVAALRAPRFDSPSEFGRAPTDIWQVAF